MFDFLFGIFVGALVSSLIALSMKEPATAAAESVKRVCEESLPRNQQCKVVVTATPEEKK